MRQPVDLLDGEPAQRGDLRGGEPFDRFDAEALTEPLPGKIIPAVCLVVVTNNHWRVGLQNGPQRPRALTLTRDTPVAFCGLCDRLRAPRGPSVGQLNG